MWTDREHFSNALVYILAVGLVIITFVLASHTGNESIPTISVQGTKIVSTLPDEARIKMSVDVTEDTAKEASAENAKIMAKVLTALKDEGVANYQIKTIYLNVYPIYDYSESPVELDGYKAVHTIEITTDEISSVSAYIDAGVEAGSNVIDSVSFVLSEGYQNQLRKEALGEATLDAKMKATAIAKSIDMDLKEPISISATASYVPFIGMERSALSEGQVPSDIQAGEIEFTVDVNVDFEID